MNDSQLSNELQFASHSLITDEAYSFLNAIDRTLHYRQIFIYQNIARTILS